MAKNGNKKGGTKARKGTSELSQNIADATAQFLKYTPAARLNMNLRRLLMNYLLSCKDAHGFDMDDLLLDLCNLMELLDVAAGEVA